MSPCSSHSILLIQSFQQILRAFLLSFHLVFVHFRLFIFSGFTGWLRFLDTQQSCKFVDLVGIRGCSSKSGSPCSGFFVQIRILTLSFSGRASWFGGGFFVLGLFRFRPNKLALLDRFELALDTSIFPSMSLLAMIGTVIITKNFSMLL